MVEWKKQKKSKIQNGALAHVYALRAWSATKIKFFMIIISGNGYGDGFPPKPLPHQNFDETCDWIKKNKSTVRFGSAKCALIR